MPKKTKKDEVQTPNNNAYFERIKALEKEVESYRKDGDKLGEEILALRRSLASYKSANSKYRKEIDHLKVLCKEADELFDGKAMDVINLKKLIDDLQKQVNDETVENKRLCDLVDTEREKYAALAADKSALQAKFDEAEQLVEIHNNKPWFKRFAKI